MPDDDELDIVHEKKPRRSTDPTNFYGFLLKIGEKWGFPALVAIAALYAGWKMVGWQRADQKVFLEAVQKNTVVIESMATEQKTATEALRKIDTNIEKHLNAEERRHH